MPVARTPRIVGGLDPWRRRLRRHEARNQEIARSRRHGFVLADNRFTHVRARRHDRRAAGGDGGAAVRRNGRVTVARPFALRPRRAHARGMIRHSGHRCAGRSTHMLRAREIAPHHHKVEHQGHREKTERAAHANETIKVYRVACIASGSEVSVSHIIGCTTFGTSMQSAPCVPARRMN